MESLISRLFLHNWQQKLVAILSSLVIWAFVNLSIIETKTIPGVPMRIVNLPSDKTILSLLPNGLLSKRITLTLTGTKDVIHDLEPGDLEVVIDASMIDHDDWIMQISKKNLVSLNPAVDLGHHVTQIYHSEHMIRLRKLITAKIPITITYPTGEPPEGYEYLDVWPQRLYQTLSGGEEEIENLKANGLELTFDLNEITKADLDTLKSSHHNLQDDEISFLVPAKWKKVCIAFHNNAHEEINDPEASLLRIDFLRKEMHTVKNEIPIRIFYPIKHSLSINPETSSLELSEIIQMKNHLTYFSPPVFAQGVSRLFLDIVRENMEITVVAAPKSEREKLLWSIDIVNPHELEDTYVAFLISNLSNGKNKAEAFSKNKEDMLRNRFRDYLQKLSLYTSQDQELKLKCRLNGNKIQVLNER